MQRIATLENLDLVPKFLLNEFDYKAGVLNRSMRIFIFKNNYFVSLKHLVLHKVLVRRACELLVAYLVRSGPVKFFIITVLRDKEGAPGWLSWFSV